MSGLSDGRDKSLRPADMMADFVPGRVVIDAAKRKRVKYEAKCANTGYGRDKPLRPTDMLLYSWDGGLDVCVDLTGSSPLTQTGMINFASGRAVFEAAQRKCAKYEAKCADSGHSFIPFSFSSFGKLVKDAVTLLKRILKFSVTQDIGARVVVHIFNMIGFAIARGVGTQIVVPFTVGKLPMKYLGVSFLAKNLRVNDCRQLIDKVKTIIGDWKNRFLSYAGRVQLISYVLASMQTYWALVYLLPKTVVKEIDKVKKNFLWSNGGNNNGRAKIAWKVGSWMMNWEAVLGYVVRWDVSLSNSLPMIVVRLWKCRVFISEENVVKKSVFPWSLKRIRKFFMAQDIGARVAVHIFNWISFAIAKGIALWKSQREDHTSDWLRAVPISGLGQTMNACSRVFAVDIYGDHDVSCAGIIGNKHHHNVVRDTLADICFRSRISVGKEVDIGLDGGVTNHYVQQICYFTRRMEVDVCVDLTGSSPLTQIGMADFVPGRARIRKCSMAQYIGARAAVHIFNMIGFAIANGAIHKLHDPQCELLLLRNYVRVTKLSYALRTCSPLSLLESQVQFYQALLGDIIWYAFLDYRLQKSALQAKILMKTGIDSRGSSFQHVIDAFNTTCNNDLVSKLVVPMFSEGSLCLNYNAHQMDQCGDHAVHCSSEVGVKFRHNIVHDILVDTCSQVGIMVRKESQMGFLSEDGKDL
ncbi:hypothetical protein Tco_0929440 [Tanacetum coccineum]